MAEKNKLEIIQGFKGWETSNTFIYQNSQTKRITSCHSPERKSYIR